jgi:CopG family nickel-responsive transcriptional regulator
MVERIGISLDRKLLAQFDKLIAEKGYSNRSEAVRDLIREKLIEQEWALPKGETVATLLLVYEHETMELSRRLARIEHEAFHHVVATLHVHMDHENCLEVIVMRGPGRELKELGDRLISLRGVKHGTFIPSTTGKNV